MSHMGEANVAMARTDRKVPLVARPAPITRTRGRQLALVTSFEPGPATLWPCCRGPAPAMAPRGRPGARSRTSARCPIAGAAFQAAAGVGRRARLADGLRQGRRARTTTPSASAMPRHGSAPRRHCWTPITSRCKPCFSGSTWARPTSRPMLWIAAAGSWLAARRRPAALPARRWRSNRTSRNLAGTCQAIGQAGRRPSSRGAIQAIGVSSQGAALQLLDASGQPLRAGHQLARRPRPALRPATRRGTRRGFLCRARRPAEAACSRRASFSVSGNSRPRSWPAPRESVSWAT